MKSRTSEETQQSRGKRASFWALVVFIPWLFAMWLGLREWSREIQLGKRAVTTVGVITRIERDHHQQYDYEYFVAGVTYHGGEIIPGASLAVGQQVHVSYIPDDPDTSTLTRFGEVGTRPVPLLLSSFLVLYFYLRLRKFLKGSGDPTIHNK